MNQTATLALIAYGAAFVLSIVFYSWDLATARDVYAVVVVGLPTLLFPFLPWRETP